MSTSTIAKLPLMGSIPVNRNTSATADGSWGAARIYGRIVTFCAVVNPTVYSTYGVYLSIDSKYAPSNDVWLSCDRHQNGDTHGQAEARITPSGEIQLAVPSTGYNGVWYKLSGSWIIKT